MFSFFKRAKGETIFVNDIDELIGRIEIIDVREPYEYKQGSLKTSKNIPMDELMNNPYNYLQKDKKYYIICQSGMRSSKVSSYLTNQEFDVVNVLGGMNNYSGNQKNR